MEGVVRWKEILVAGDTIPTRVQAAPEDLGSEQEVEKTGKKV